MSDRITTHEYDDEIQSIADEAKRAVIEEGAYLHDWIHETIDGHQWVIYTAYNHEVLAISENDDAGITEGLVDAGAAVKEGGMARLYAQLAFCAMEQDVFDKIGGWEPDECVQCGVMFDPENDAESAKHEPLKFDNDALTGYNREYGKRRVNDSTRHKRIRYARSTRGAGPESLPHRHRLFGTR